MINTATKKTMLWAFIILQLIAYTILNCVKISFLHFLSYSITSLCFVFALIYISKHSQKYFQIGAFVFTLLADFFLIALGGKHKTLATSLFLVVQLFYACRVYYLAYYPKERLTQLGVRFIVSVLAIVLSFVMLKEKLQAFFIIFAVGYLNMIISAIFLFKHYKESLWVKLLLVGLILFLLSSAFVGVNFIATIFNFQSENVVYKISNLSIKFINIFYPLSQIIIACSVMVKTH